MQRAHIFLIVALVLVLIASVSAVRVLQKNSASQNTDTNNTQGYTTFNAPENIFASLIRRSTDEDSPSAASTSAIETEQQRAIQTIIRSWEERAGSSDARAARITSTQNTNPSSYAPPTEQEDITQLFNALISPNKISDKLGQQDTTSDSSYESLWSGNYSQNTSVAIREQETPTQQSLRNYANSVGALLTTFNTTQGNQTKLLDTFIKNRTRTADLERLTRGYTQLSKDLARITPPAPVTTVHTGLIKSYASVGELLWNLRLATNDEELLARMLTYNKASEDVARNHVTLITLLSAHGVVFKSYESGSVFSFTPPSQNGL